MIGAAVLGEVVGADALGSIAAAHHGFSGAHLGGVLFGLFRFIKRCAEQCPGAFFVLGLTFVFGHLESRAGGFVQELPAGFDFVDVLAARAAAAAAGFFDVFGVDLDLHVFQFRQHRNGG